MIQPNDKEEILKTAQKDSFFRREYENHSGTRGTLLASIISFLVGIILFLIEFFSKSSWNIGLLVVAMTSSCTRSLYEGIKLKTAWKIVLGSIEAIITLILILAFIQQVTA